MSDEVVCLVRNVLWSRGYRSNQMMVTAEQLGPALYLVRIDVALEDSVLRVVHREIARTMPAATHCDVQALTKGVQSARSLRRSHVRDSTDTAAVVATRLLEAHSRADVGGCDPTDAVVRSAAMARQTFSLRMLVDSIPEPAWTARADGFFDFYNRRWYEYTGATPEEMEGWGWQSVHHPDLRTQFEERWRASLQMGQSFEMEVLLRGADGTYRWFLTRAAPVRDDEDIVVGWFGTHTNVDESRRQHDALTQAVANETRAREETEAALMTAVRAVRAREELLAVVSHDLRGPLSAVLMSAELLADSAPEGEPGARARKAVNTIAMAVGRMTRLIDDLLDLARLEQGQLLPVNLETQDAVALVHSAVEMFRPVAGARRLQLITELPEPVHLPCDGERVQQALSNLIGNAVKFTRDGGTIRVGAQRIGAELLVTVTDSGIGIPPENIPHVFDAYWQSDPSKKKRGAGLGLSIVKAIVETHGGRVSVDSTPGKGSTFSLSLPLAATVSPSANTHDG